MNCNDIMTQFLELDNGKSIPFRLKLHVLICSQCRSEIFMLKKSFKSMADDSSFYTEIDISAEIMHTIKHNVFQNIERLEVSYEHNISLIRWVGVGFIILTSLFVIPFSASLSWARNEFGSNLEIPLSIIMGLAITVYAAIFIGTHIKDLNRFAAWIGKKIM